MMAPLDAILYVGYAAPTRLLFQSARLDEASARSDAQSFFDAASKPKLLKSRRRKNNPSPLTIGKVGVEGIAPAFETSVCRSITQKVRVEALDR